MQLLVLVIGITKLHLLGPLAPGLLVIRDLFARKVYCSSSITMITTLLVIKGLKRHEHADYVGIVLPRVLASYCVLG